MHPKRGQITIFLVIGIIILFATGLVLYLRSFAIEKELKVEANQLPVEKISGYVDSCILSVAQDGIFDISSKGGFYKINGTYGIPYYFYEGKETMPKKEIIEKQLSLYIENNLSDCLNNFENFRTEGYNFETSNISVNSTIAAKNVVINVNYPIKITKDNQLSVLNEFSVPVDINFYEKYNLIRKIIDEQNKTPNSIPFSSITGLAYKNNFTFEVINFPDDIVFYVFTFNTSLRNKPLIYPIKVKYNWSAIFPQKNVEIYPIPEFVISAPQIFKYQVKARGTDLKFYDDTTMFDIDPKNGSISFDTTRWEDGVREIKITATDKYGNSDTAYMTIDIEQKNLLPSINSTIILDAAVNKTFYYKVNASDPYKEYLYFEDNTSLFDINPTTGEINFMPNQTGDYSIKITVGNNVGYSEALMLLKVK